MTQQVHSLPPTASGRLVARLRPGLEAQHPSVGRTWHPVLERNLSALQPDPTPETVWVRIRGRTRLLPIALFEFREAETIDTAQTPNHRAAAPGMADADRDRRGGARLVTQTGIDAG